MQLTTPSTNEQLRELAVKHSVRYEVYFEKGSVGPDLVNDGFEIDLLGSHDGCSCATPGCELCIGTFHDLRKIAESIMPKERGDYECSIDTFDSALHMDMKHRMRPEVQLVIKIEHKEPEDGPVDDVEWRCLEEMEEALHALGIVKSRGPGHNFSR